MEVILYTTHCPLCRGAEMALKKNNIKYSTVDNVDDILARGFTHTPVLVVDNEAFIGKALHDKIREIGEGK